ncbi:MAG TPA: hypothetical protein VHR55_01700 [Candidatus Limnocylindria bacterium]|nr:hypothetical protein [Candidatus Limnocylindria bacterium]
MDADKTISDRPMDDETPRAADTPEREGGAWIGQHPDPNTEKVREDLDPGAERVAVTDNESGDVPADDRWPQGHRQGDHAGDDDLRRAGENA